MKGMQPSRSSRTIVKALLRNELGQMSVFLALVFQVLFVFFAMVINIGLLVHDKINLQNSVDLGAYYAAQKQAEILNEIAHLNYQIRQDYKLLAWRYWVVGTLGRDGGPASDLPPARRLGVMPETVRLYRGIEEAPVACLATPQWWEFAVLRNGQPPNENYCYQNYNWVSQAIPVPSVPFTPATIGAGIFARTMAEQGRANYTMSCDGAGPLSWAFVATIMTSYKHSVAYKKKAIRALRANLVSADPKDRDGVSIREGVIQTIKKNLTESNLQSFDPTTVQVLNGLTKGGCNGGGIYPGETTLPEVLTGPGLYYAVLRGTPGAQCAFSLDFQRNYSQLTAPGVIPWDPDGYMRSLLLNEPGPDSEFHSTLGFEKNPWCMSYMGVKANTSPRKPFAPFGQSVNLVARAFAQPFGGRIGPWYSKTWVRGGLTSDPVAPPTASALSSTTAAPLNPAAGQDLRTDWLTSPRIIPGSSGGYVYSSYTIPNFSRFPGDRLGLRSQRAQSMSQSFFRDINTLIGASRSAPGNFGDKRLRLNWFYGYGSMNVSGDSLAFDDPALANLNGIPAIVMRYREIEMTAVAPDLFDATYYSIDPAANQNYTTLARTNPSRYGIVGAPVGDLGTRQNIPDLQGITIEAQVTTAMNGGVDAGLKDSIYWLLRSWTHLLTSWSPNRATDFTFPTFRFGQCQTLPTTSTMIPGKCVGGGRVGYSVRLVSRAHLNGEWSIGGDGAQPGMILNAPGDDSEF